MSGASHNAGGRRARRALGSALFLLSATVVAAGLCYLASARPARIDMTPGGEQSLSARTAAILNSLTGPHEIAMVAPRGSVEPRVRRALDDLLDRFARSPGANRAGVSLGAAWIDPTTERGLRDYDALVGRLAAARAGVIESHRKAIGDAVSAARLLAAELPGLAERAEKGRAGAAQVAGLRACANELASLGAQGDGAFVVRLGGVDLPASDAARNTLRGPLERAGGACEAAASALRAAPRDAGDASGASALAAALGGARDAALSAREKLDATAREPLDLLELARALESRGALIVASPARSMPLRIEALVRSAETGEGGISAAEARFAGEEAIASALATLSDARPPIVVLAHAAGAALLDEPLTGHGAPATPEAQQLVGRLIDRLRLRGADVVEWPLESHKARPALSALDPSGARPVVWVLIPVAATIPDANAKSATLAKAAGELLDSGECALVTLEPSLLPRVGEPDPLAALLAPLGIEAATGRPIFQRVATNRGAVPTPELRLSPKATADGSPIARAIDGLTTTLPWPSALTLRGGGDQAAATLPILSLPAGASTWAESQWLAYRATPREQRLSLPDQPAPDAARDTLGPGTPDNRWTVGATAERARPQSAGVRAGGPAMQRVVVVAASGWFFDPVAEEAVMVDGRAAPANPGNSELFDASISWLAGQDDQIAASPRARSVPRVADIAPSRLAALRWAVVLVPPALVALLGLALRLLRG